MSQRWNPPNGGDKPEESSWKRKRDESDRRGGDLDRRGRGGERFEDGSRRAGGEPYRSGRNRGYDVDKRREISKWTVSAEDRWRCEECKSENIGLGGNAYCSHCGAPRAPAPEAEDRYRRPRSSSEGGRGGRHRDYRDRGERCDDHYGPRGEVRRPHRREEGPSISRRFDHGDDGPPRKLGKGSRSTDRGRESRPSSEWPPPFDKAGAAYVFDARSGFFYEALSDFFYDPKTKLYYGNKQKAYFSHVQGEKPPFRMVSQPQQTDQIGEQVGSGGSFPSLVHQADPASNPSSLTGVNAGALNPSASKAGKPEKKKIAISLGKLGKKTKPGNTPVKPLRAVTVEDADSAGLIIGKKPVGETQGPGSATSKRHVADINKWSVKKQEIRSDVVAPVSSTAPPQAGAVPAPTTTVPTTAAGRPICFLCKRKFASMEKLREHEEMSALHKQNLAKAASSGSSQQKKTEAPTTTGSSASYRDRAKERRQIFGSEPTKGAESASPEREEVQEVVRPEEHLGDGNVGNVLLQKMGWQKGKSLGRKVDETDAHGNVAKRAAVSDKLREDWERIEGLAGSNGAGRGRGARGRGGGIGA